MKVRLPSFKVACLECEHRFSTKSLDPRCPRCGGVDIEPAEVVVTPKSIAETHAALGIRPGPRRRAPGTGRRRVGEAPAPCDRVLFDDPCTVCDEQTPEAVHDRVFDGPER